MHCPYCNKTIEYDKFPSSLVWECPECTVLTYVALPPNHISRFHHFNLESIIGRGANSLVYRAVNTQTNKTIALKLFKPLDHKTAYNNEERFKQEVHIQQEVEHDGIIQLYSSGEFGLIHYIEMEYFEAMDLSSYLKRNGCINSDLAVTISLSVLETLDHAWSTDLAIHRDIKPHNILLNRKNVVKICDFGMANEHGEWFDESKIDGTPLYLSPESINGDYQDNRSDIYSFGITLFQLLAGTVPFDKPSLKDTIFSRINSEAPDLRDYVAGIPDNLARVIKTMMAVNPDERYATAYECRQDFLRIQNGEAVQLVDPNRPRLNQA